MNTRISTHTALFSLVVGALACACGSAVAREGAPPAATGSAAQAASGAAAFHAACDGDGERHDGGHEGRHHGDLFRAFDKDGDGKVALADLPEPIRDHLKGADTNADGVLTVDEVKAARTAQHAKREAALDTNGDGVVSDDERKAAQGKLREMWVARHDANHDGAITKDEVSPRTWERISAADANKDGRIDGTEMATLPPRHGHRPSSG